MRSIDLYTAVRAVDDDILERSETAVYGQKKNGWLKWGAMAACICLCVVGAISIFYPKGGSQDSNVQAIAALELNGCYYEVCDIESVLESCGLPNKITAEMAGEHLAYLKHSNVAGYEETATQTDIELYQYAPSPCRGVYVVRDGESYMAALFCNFRLFDSNTNVELSELYRVYGVDGAEDISVIAYTESKPGIEAVVNGTVSDAEAIAEFYEHTTSLVSFGNDDFQAIMFNNIPEEDKSAAHTAFADDAMTVRIETKTGMRFNLRVYPSYGWIYGPGTQSYYRIDDAIFNWAEKYSFEGYSN